MSKQHFIPYKNFVVSKDRFKFHTFVTKKGQVIFQCKYRYDDGHYDQLKLSTPSMTCPFGVTCTDDMYLKEGQQRRYYLQASFKNKESDEGMKIFFDKMTQFDKILIDMVHENSLEYLNDEGATRKEVLTAMRSGGFNVRYNFEKEYKDVKFDTYPPPEKYLNKYDPYMRYKVYKNYSNSSGDRPFDVDIYNREKEPITIDDVPKFAECKSIIEFYGLRKINDSLYNTWKLAQSIVIKSETSRIPTNAIFGLLDEGDEEVESSEYDYSPSSALIDEAREEDPNFELETAPKPKKTTKKKTTKRSRIHYN